MLDFAASLSSLFLDGYHTSPHPLLVGQEPDRLFLAFPEGNRLRLDALDRSLHCKVSFAGVDCAEESLGPRPTCRFLGAPVFLPEDEDANQFVSGEALCILVFNTFSLSTPSSHEG